MKRWGKLGDVEFSLALSVPKAQRYQRRLIPVDPEGSDDYRLEDGLPATRKVARWKVDEWSAGEGNTKWKRGDAMYHLSDDVRPVRIGDGLELGAAVEVGQYLGADLSEAIALGVAEGALQAGNDDGYVYSWSGGALGVFGFFDVARRAIGSTSAITSICDAGGTYTYTGHADGSIRRVNAAGSTNEEVIAAATTTEVPYIFNFDGKFAELWVLDGHDLYLVDVSGGVPGTYTLKADLNSNYKTTGVGTKAPRICRSERGLIWLKRTSAGDTEIWEYNVFADSQVRMGVLPPGSYAYSVGYFNGFVFVGFRTAEEHAQPGDAYIYFQRGAQRGVLGPVRSPSDDPASKPVVIVGQYGEKVLFAFDGVLWAYTPSGGGLSYEATLAADSNAAHVQGAVFGHQAFVSNENGKVDVVLLQRYATSGTLDSGRHDFAYPGLKKMLTDVTVETDPLPASTSVSVSVSVDRGSFAALTGTHDVDGAAVKVFTASAPGALVMGREFEVRVTLAGTETVTPVVRAVTARATGAAWEEEWVMAIDCDTAKVGGAQDSAAAIAALKGLTASGMVTFTNPFEVDQHTAAETVTVTIEDVILPDEESDEPAVATVRVRARDLTEVS